MEFDGYEKGKPGARVSSGLSRLSTD